MGNETVSLNSRIAPSETLELLPDDSATLPTSGAASCMQLHPHKPSVHHPCEASKGSCLIIAWHRSYPSSVPVAEKTVKICSSCHILDTPISGQFVAIIITPSEMEDLDKRILFSFLNK
jgi:hypothetical protein